MNLELIVTCDDCGLSEGINYAAIELYQKQIANSASVITNFPATKHAYWLFAQYPKLKCGVHLNLTDGYPLQKIPSPSPLTRADGYFKSRKALFAQALHPTSSFMNLVEAELTTQIEHFYQSNLNLYHLTTHSQFHIFPALRRIVYKLASKYHIDWIRNYHFTSLVLPVNPFLRHKTWKDKKEKRQDLFWTNYLIPIIFWLRTDPHSFSKQMKNLKGIAEIVVHPSTPNDQSFPAGVRYLPNQRFLEMQYLEKAMAQISEASLV